MIDVDQFFRSFIKDQLPEARHVVRQFMSDMSYNSDPQRFLERLSALEDFVVSDEEGASALSHSVRGSVLQVARLLKKMRLSTDASQSINAFHDRQLNLGYAQLRSDEYELARTFAKLMLGPVTGIQFKPAHGPGSVAEGNFGLDKSNLVRAPNTSYGWSLLDLDPLCRVPEGDGARHTRVTSVEKDWRGRRVIGMEPAWRMFSQLSLKGAMEHHSAAYIPYYNQGLQRQRLVGEYPSRLATLDLSSASDYLTVDLAHEILPESWFSLLVENRTPSYTLPDGSVHRTESFALMGNGFCFPCLSVIVTSLCFAAAAKCLGLRPTYSTIHQLRDYWGIQVFGDDIVFPSCMVDQLVFTLASAGLKLNRAKSGFGTFRETCGFYQFGDESPFICYYLRTAESTELEDVLRLVALQNTLFNHGYRNAAKAIERGCPTGIPRTDIITTRTFGKALYSDGVTSLTRYVKKEGSYKTPLLGVSCAQRDVLLADTTGWVASLRGIPLRESVGPTRGSVRFRTYLA